MSIKTCQQLIEKARRRDLLDRALRDAGWGLTVGLILSLVVLALDRGLQLNLPWFIYAILAGAGFVAGLGHAFATRPDRLAVAVRLDRTLGLKDRIGTAAYISELLPSEAESGASPHTAAVLKKQDAAFAELVRRDAQQLAKAVDVRSAVPVRITGIWGAAITLSLALVLGVLYLPQWHWPTRAAQPQVSPQQAQLIQERTEELTQAIEHVRMELPPDETLDEEVQAELEALDRLAEQFASGDASQREIDAARDEAAARMTQLADRLAQQADRDLAIMEEMSRRFSSMDALESPHRPLSAAEFEQALRRGDFGQAGELLEELLREQQQLPEAERHAAAERLRQLSQQVQQSAEQPDVSSEERAAQLMQTLRDQGMDEQTLQELMDDPQSAQKLEEELLRQNVDKELAQRLAREWQQLQEQQTIDEQVRDNMQDVADTLHDAAEQLDPATPPEPEQPPQPQQQQQEQQQQQQQERQEPGAAEPQPTGNQQSQQPDQQQQQPGQSQSESQQTQQRDNHQQQDQQNQQQRQQQQPGDQPRQGEGQPQQQQDQQPQQGGEGQPQQGESPSQTEGQPQPSPSSSPQDEQPPGASGGGDASDQPSAQDQQSPQQQQQSQQQEGSSDSAGQQDQQQQRQPDGGQPGQQSSGEGGEETDQPQQPSSSSSPSERLRQLAQQRDRAADRRQSSERLREAAHRLSDNMTPEQREQWARQWQQQNEGQTPPGQPQQQSSADGSSGAGAGSGDTQSAQRNGNRYQPQQTRDLDLRGDDPGRQIIADWLTNEHMGEPGSTTEQSQPMQRVRQAQDVAERAVNDSAVHRRYHKAIMRYFGRLDETARRAAGENTTSSSSATSPQQPSSSSSPTSDAPE